jgi:hypothetical protein
MPVNVLDVAWVRQVLHLGALLAGALAAALPLASIFAGTGVLLILGGLGFLTAPDRIAPIDAEVSA